jgi:hypothetical protein
MVGKQDFRLADLAERWLRPWPVTLCLLLAVSLLTRFTMLGDPNYHADETLFFLIGQRMHDGLLPYVDLWDRKGPGLFLLYYLFAGISASVLSYQTGALVFAGLTAFVINRIALLWTGRLGALLAGVLYLVSMPRFLGGGGQAAVFFNLFIALAAWLVLRAPQGRAPTQGTLAAMLLAGIAATFKQTCLFDGVFLGLLLLLRHRQAGATLRDLLATGAGYAMAGALPMLAAFACYAAVGHFAELWHALVWSNLTKVYNPTNDYGLRVLSALVVLGPTVLLVLAGFAKGWTFAGKTAPRWVLAGWLVANLAALVAIPNLIDHYLLPVIVVTSLAAAPVMQREPWGMIGGIVAIGWMLAFGPQFDAQTRAESRRAIPALAAEIRASSPAPRLFIYEGPVALYTATGLYPPTPLLFPLHLNALPERNVSHMDTAGEVRRVLDWQPTVVLVAHKPARLVNRETRAMVMAYVQSRCRLLGTRDLPNRFGADLYDVWGDCEPRTTAVGDPASTRSGAAISVSR